MLFDRRFHFIPFIQYCQWLLIQIGENNRDCGETLLSVNQSPLFIVPVKSDNYRLKTIKVAIPFLIILINIFQQSDNFIPAPAIAALIGRNENLIPDLTNSPTEIVFGPADTSLPCKWGDSIIKILIFLKRNLLHLTSREGRSEDFQGDGGACFGVGEGVVMVGHIVAAGGGYSVEAMARKVAQASAGCGEGAVELIVGVRHAVFGEDGFQAALVEGAVVGHQRQAGDAGLYLLPHIGEEGVSVGVAAGEAVNLGCLVGIIVGNRLNERVEFIYYLAVAHHDNADAADARPPLVGRLEINRCKVFHDMADSY